MLVVDYHEGNDGRSLQGGGVVRRALLAGLSVILASVCGVVTALVTAHPSRGLWVALAVVVVAAATSQVVMTYGERRDRGRVEASGAGAVAVGGTSRGEIRTRAYGGPQTPALPARQDGVSATGLGAVSIGGDTDGPVSTDANGDQAGRS